MHRNKVYCSLPKMIPIFTVAVGKESDAHTRCSFKLSREKTQKNTLTQYLNKLFTIHIHFH